MKGFSDRLGEVQEYYFSKKLKEVQKLRESGKPIINMGIGSPDLPPDKSVIEALKQTADNSSGHGYQSYQGTPELRNAMAAFYDRNYQVSLDPVSEVLPLMGSKEGIMHISMAFLNEGDEVLVPNPGYPTYTSVTKLLNAIPVFYSLNEADNWAPDWEALEKMDLAKVKLMWVNYPHMPTGANGNEALFGKLIDFAKSHDILLVHDNPYSFILNDTPQSLLAIPEAKDYALELNSLSKTFNIPGWRVGMLAGRKDYLEAVLRVKSNMDSGMFLGLQAGAVAALNLDPSWINTMNAIYARRKALVLEMAALLHLQVDEEAVGMFVWGKVPDGKEATEIVDQLLYDYDIFITPGLIFGSNGASYVRFSLCIDEDKIKEAIARLKKHKTL
ncbi:aminotransferase class I/II-fold pyridoxal phosphate-dependent enzyme [Cyclobacterium sp. 1_MG-2023]|uniref:pyridoxal phosphate-dependent aminotransferase n=1 Tax=Cyclobacterium sp. 1_MG-2023 TaxID=3062681 RepID=UPI0026E1927B|nr:aminotransferase class I/II-fold pyridoxal phosphate-dependent enzyme [Cyclobacterium sp. 1_MG-2023]MDO6438306.1 aminotransferase class I/II-fold pyridoxal phosphate-dependent enzyme [Cyclobacterium sp. 1_MG-2023]